MKRWNKKKIDHHKKIPLSDADVMRLVEGKAKVLVYDELNDYNSLDDIIGPHGACFILYGPTNFGHWTALFKMKDGKTVEFFDPYGKMPDHWLDKNKYPILSYYLYHSGYNLTYNEHAFQAKGEGINTCGRWCALRLVFRDLSLKGFAKLFKHVGADDLVSILTSYDLDY